MNYNDMKIIKIPKDPRTNENIFIEEFPLDLLGHILPDEWYKHINGLNRILKSKEKPSFWNFIKTILVFPALMSLDSYDNDVKKYLVNVNKILGKSGIYILDPSSNGYLELEVCIFNLNIE